LPELFKNSPYLYSRELLVELHWLPTESRIEFKIVCITYTALTSIVTAGQQTYLGTLL